ncbi:MAG TPA: hypothetical protein VNA67_10155 [Pseudonocardiaceae bacterium]|nr:hypothetical protein [Pseudonocardiaceae bacterium]
MLLTLGLLLVAVVLLIAALSTGHLALAWVSVALSAVVAALIVMRWRRRRDEPEVQPVVLLDDEPADALPGDKTDDPARDVTPGEPSPQPASVAAAEHGDPVVEAAPVASDQGSSAGQTGEDIEAGEEGEPGEEDTDAADLLVVYELNDEVLVVDEHPRYHLARCTWPDRERGERLPVREARELGFTPCDRCRPDAALARRHRAASATTGRS